MSDCCTPANLNSPARSGDHCPICGVKGKAVDTRTVNSLLALSLEVLRPTDYRFCRTTDCPVVYFSTDGVQTFQEADLRERVHQKAPQDDDVLVCYCFRHTPGSICAELTETGASTVVERISAGVQAGKCGCDIRNPQGSCCLGNVRAVVKRVARELSVGKSSHTHATLRMSKLLSEHL